VFRAASVLRQKHGTLTLYDKRIAARCEKDYRERMG
jgi:hypothetical protein